MAAPRLFDVPIHDTAHRTIHEIPILDARWLAGTRTPAQEIEARGFCLVGDVHTTMSRRDYEERFLSQRVKGVASTITFDRAGAVRGTSGPFHFRHDAPGIRRLAGDANAEYAAQNQLELATAVSHALPGAELLCGYNQVVRSSAAPATEAGVAVVDGDAADTAAGILGRLAVINSFPPEFRADLKSRYVKEQQKRHGDDDSALVEAVRSWYLHHYYHDRLALDDVALSHCAALEGPSWEPLRAALLRGDLAPVKEQLGHGDRSPSVRAADEGLLDTPATGAAHSDSTDESAMAVCEGVVAGIEAACLHQFQHRRYVCYHLNAWRNIDKDNALEDYHLAVLDKTSVETGTHRQRPFDEQLITVCS